MVCTANQCRSPMAEGLIRARLEAEGLAGAVTVTSAGTWAMPDSPASAHAVAAMAERGIDLSDHLSRTVHAPLLAEADLVLAMTDGHRQAMEAEFPDARGKVRLLAGLAGGTWDVADPVGGSLDDYRATASELERLIDAGWAEITGASA